MFRKCLTVLLVIVILFSVITTFPLSSSAQEVDLADTSSYADERWQWTDDGVQQERCTYRAWHETKDRLGVSLPLTWGNAGSWATSAKRDGYDVDMTPRVNSIVCWYKSLSWGHVAYVTGVDDNNIYIREAGINPSSSYPNYWFRDTSFSRSNQNRWNGYSLQGYIHLAGNPITYANMDVNFWVDGKEQYSIDGIGNIQVYVDGQLQQSGGMSSYTDFYQDVVVGKYYEVKINITNSNYHFGGVDTQESGYTGITGTTGAGGTRVRLVIVKDDDGIKDLPDGNYQIISVIDNSYGIDITGSAIPAYNGDNVQLYPIGTTPRQEDIFTLTNLGNGYYSIKQKNTDMAIGVYGASSDRWGDINVWDYNNSTNSSARQWKIRYDSELGGYTLQAKCSGMYLTLDGGVIGNDTNIYQNIKSVIPKAQGWLIVPCDNTMDISFYVDGKEQKSIDGIGTIQVYVDNQLLTTNGNTSYTKFSQLVKHGKPYEIKVDITNNDYYFRGVDTYDGALDLSGNTGYSDVKIRLVICKDSGGIQYIPNGDYQIVSIINNSYGVDIDGNDVPANDEDNIQLYPIGSSPRKQDVFTFTNLGNGYYSIKQKDTNMAVGVYGASCDRWGNVNVWDYNSSINTNARQWKICYDDELGGYTLQAKCSGMYLTLDGGVIGNGTNIYQNIKSVIPKAQGWLLIPYGDTKPIVIPTEPEVRYILGDADGDGVVTIIDATNIQRKLVNMPVSNFDKKAADVDGNGLDITDATFIQRFLAEIEIPYRIGEPRT